MNKDSKLHRLLTTINAAGGSLPPHDAQIINLTEELSHYVRGGLNTGCGEELPGNNSSCSNANCTNDGCNGSNNPTNGNCTNRSCITFSMDNVGCNNPGCTN
jgi:hypothetical protein